MEKWEFLASVFLLLLLLLLLRLQLSLQVLVVVVGEDGVLRLDHVLLQLSLPLLVHLDLGWGKGGHGDELQVGVADQLASQPEEGLLEVVVRLGGDVVVLQVLFSVKNDRLGLHLAVLNVHLVAGEDDGNILADAHQITMPVGNVFVCDARRDVKHDDGTFTFDVVTVAEAAKLLLASSVPDVEFDRAAVGVEHKRVHLDAKGSDIFLLEFTRQVTLDKGGLAGTAIADKQALEGWHLGFIRLLHLSGG